MYRYCNEARPAQRRDHVAASAGHRCRWGAGGSDDARAKRCSWPVAAELDLVEVSPTAEPPVVRVMDFGKFLFEQNKKAHSAKRKQKQIQVKEVKFRPGTEEADYQVKLRNLIRFLTEGDKAKVTLRFRGREMAHQEIGRKLLDAGADRPRRTWRGRAVPADGRPADGHGVCAKKEVIVASRRASAVSGDPPASGQLHRCAAL